MSDTRWTEIEADIANAAEHFVQAAALFDEGGFGAPGTAGYRARMAFMHAMLAGHTSLESGLIRIMDMIREDPPTGAKWHPDLIRRVGRHSGAAARQSSLRAWRPPPTRRGRFAI